MTKRKPVDKLTTEEAARRLFPKPVRDAIREEARKSDSKGEAEEAENGEENGEI